MASRQLGAVILLLLFLSVLELTSIGAVPFEAASQTTHLATDQSLSEYPAELAVTVLQIDPSRLAATIQIIAFVYSSQLLGNNTLLAVGGSGWADIPLSIYSNFNLQNGKIYEYKGDSGIILWWMRGEGALYPFDHYFLFFDLDPLLNPSLNQTGNLQLRNDSHAAFNGNATLSLLGNWQASPENLLLSSLVYQTSMTVYLTRRPLPALSMVIAILSSYALVGCSLVLEVPKRLSSRLTVYTSIFILAFTLYSGLQNSQPYHSTLSVLDILFLGLIACTAEIGCMSMLGRADSRGTNGLDFASTIIAGALLTLFVYSAGMLQILTSELPGNPYPLILFLAAVVFLITPCALFNVQRRRKTHT